MNKKIIVNLVLGFISMILFVYCYFNSENSFVYGMAVGMFSVVLLNTIRLFRQKSNKEYREKLEIAENDERIIFIQNTAAKYTMKITIVVLGIICLFFAIKGKAEISYYIGISMCLFLVLYSGIFYYLARKN